MSTMNRVIHCIDCSSIYALTPFDTTPEYRGSGFGSEVVRVDKNDRVYFDSRHNNHHQEELAIIDPALYSEGAYYDPCRVTYLTATNGKETFLIKKWRGHIDEALRYDLVDGLLDVKETVSIQKDDLRKQLACEIKDPLLSEEKMQAFIDLFQEEALQSGPAQEPGEVCASNYAHICFKPLTEEQIAGIISRCKTVFTQEEWERLAGFVMNNCQENGVMSVVIRKTARLVSASYRSRVMKWSQQIFNQP